MSAFYQILDSLDQVPGRWHLGEPIDENGIEVDARMFNEGRRVLAPSLLTVPQVCPGAPLDFTFAAFDMPVVRSDVMDLLQHLAGEDIQRIPAKIKGEDERYEIVSVVKTIECLDEKMSCVMRWTDSDGRPDKVGQYRMIDDLRIQDSLAAGSHLFRLKGWEIALICSDLIKTILERHGVTGVMFRKV